MLKNAQKRLISIIINQRGQIKALKSLLKSAPKDEDYKNRIQELESELRLAQIENRDLKKSIIIKDNQQKDK